MNDKPYIKVLLLIATTTLLLTGCASTEITQTKTDTTVELGSACNLNITDFFELGSKVNTSDILIDTSSVDANTIGDYEATVTYKKNTYKINVSVTDTTAPAITAKTDIEPVEAGITIKASDYVEVTDLSNCTVYFITDEGEKETLDIPSDYRESTLETTVIAVDNQNNRSNTINIIVKTDEEKASLEEEQSEAPASTVEQETTATYDEYYAKYSQMSLEELESLDADYINNMGEEELLAYLDADSKAYDEYILSQHSNKSQQSQAQTPPRDPNKNYFDETLPYSGVQYEYVEDTGIH